MSREDQQRFITDLLETEGFNNLIHSFFSFLTSMAQASVANPLLAYVFSLVFIDIATRTRVISQFTGNTLFIAVNAYFGVKMADEIADSITGMIPFRFGDVRQDEGPDNIGFAPQIPYSEKNE